MNSQSITPKISSHGLINNHEQFDLNYSTIHIFSQKYFVNTIHVNCGTLASAADPSYSDFWWTPGLGRPPYPLRDLPHFHGSPRTWDLGLKHQILTKWVPTELLRTWDLGLKHQILTKWVPTELVAQLVPTS